MQPYAYETPGETQGRLPLTNALPPSPDEQFMCQWGNWCLSPSVTTHKPWQTPTLSASHVLWSGRPR